MDKLIILNFNKAEKEILCKIIEKVSDNAKYISIPRK